MTRIRYDREDDGRHIAEAVDYPGCIAYGATKAEARENALALVREVEAMTPSPHPAAAIQATLDLRKKDVAALVGESQASWSHYTTGRRDPKSRRLAGWLDLLREAGDPLSISLTADGWLADSELADD